MTDFELPRCVQRHDGKQRAAEQPLDDADVVAMVDVDLLELLVDGVQRVECVSVFEADRE